jgi:DNA-binding response OmpR family regulator
MEKFDVEGSFVLVHLIVNDLPLEMKSGLVANATDIHALLSSKLEKMVSSRPVAIIEFVTSSDPLVRLSPLPNETVLRAGPLELDLLDRTAKRGDRQINLKPREFQLLKYMMQRSGKMLTRAAIFEEVWHYKFVPKTNLVDVYIGRLRRKVDGSNEAPMIRSVRGVGFVLSATPQLRGRSKSNERQM